MANVWLIYEEANLATLKKEKPYTSSRAALSETMLVCLLRFMCSLFD